MLELTEFSGTPFWLNPDHVIRIDARPDTIITLHTGDKVLVREDVPTVKRRFIEYKQLIHSPSAGLVASNELPFQTNPISS